MAGMDTSPHGPLAPASADPADYLAADDVIDHGHPAIRALAAELRRDTAEETARATFEYVRDEISHSFDAGEWSCAYRASDVLAHRNAICHGKSHLLAALLRAQGIPAGLCYQKLEVLHGLNAVYWPETGQWVRLDARGNNHGADGRFATVPAEERLAWANDPDKDQYHYPTVYPATPPVLLAGLAEAKVGTEGYGYLPSEL
ncbi:transglutaminase family protein [Kitasatospora atroaurantiaca]|uniref:Transglutaminase superfamily protein n=2 Tax=Kitasatospora atroaurantiaca TaxID=285545 RepID=A0A561ETA6_9ACTN|nr:transglutaminase superfamily protein [Kitasatospora atroaurantiaca]